MKIVYNALTIKKPLTGIQLLVFNQLHNLAKYDRENKYLVLLPSEISLNINNENFKIKYFKVTSPIIRILIEQFIVPIILIFNKADIYFSTSFVIPIFSPIINKVKYCLNAYDLSYLKARETVDFFTYWYYRILIPFSFKKAFKLFAISETVKNEISELLGIEKNKIEVTYPALPENNSKEKNIQEISLPDKYILSIGRLEKRKNLLTLVKAYKIYSETENDPLPLVIAGFKGYGSSEIENFITVNNLQNLVKLPGFIESLNNLYKNAIMFIFPSIYEGFGFPIIEAFSHKVPVILSDIPIFREIAGDGALYFKPTEPQELAIKINELISENQMRGIIIENGNNRVKEFTWEKSVLKIIRAIKL